ncbi:hypothetical protein FOA52_008622 [Chlamydomonas sp. UWO 241]|nr:hypothetical protein FOA52_008622 [Chlamydomonas sp. UWO 241]
MCAQPRAGAVDDPDWIHATRFIHAVDVADVGMYGTRSQIVLALWHDGTAELRERYLADTGDWRTVAHTFSVRKLSAHVHSDEPSTGSHTR